VLRVVLNEEDKGEFFLLLMPDNDVLIKRDDLSNTGLKEGIGREIQFEGETYISLKSITELTFKINEEDVSLNITAAPDLFKEQSIDTAYRKPYKVTFTKDSSAFLNYALTYDRKTEEPFLNLSGELGVSAGDYLGLSTFTYEKKKDTEDITRLMTNITANDRKGLRTLILGDFSASSGILGSGAVLGGLNLSKNFSINPYFLKYPSINLSGILETPSEVELYLDDLLVRREQLSPGGFLFNDVPATVGLGTAKIIIRDAYGREKIISKPYYYTDHLLKKGFNEYSYSIGFLREDIGIKSFSYGNPAFLGFHNIGVSNNLKLGYVAEASKNLINIGPAISILTSKAGVLDIAFAVSSSDGSSGMSSFLGYSFQSKNIGASVSLRSDSRKYSNIAVTPFDDKAKLQFNSALGISLGDKGSITAEYSSFKMHIDKPTSRIALHYIKTLTKWATFFMTASETKDTETHNEVFLGLHVYLGKDVSGNLSYMGREGSETKTASIQKSLPLGSGFGYRASVENYDDKNNVDGNFQYQNSRGIYEAGFSNKIKDNGYSLSIAGGIGYIDKSVFLSRPINDSFAKVKVDKLEGVRTYYYGNEAGRTDSKGEVIIPNLSSFNDNRIEIESRDIPIDYTIPLLTQYVSPPYRSGSLVNFDVIKIQGFVGSIYILEETAETPVEFAVMLIQAKDKTIEGLIGKDGEFYFENIPAGEHQAKIIYKGKECKFDIIIPESEDIMVDLGKIVCEVK
jgi:outer membrane usher protein